MTIAPKLRFQSVRVRAVAVPMRPPIVSKIGTYSEWPLLLIDLLTKEGVVGRSYLEPYLKQAIRYVGAAMVDLGDASKGRPLAPLNRHRDAIGVLHLLGRQGVSPVAAAGLGMAIWDALAKAAGLPLAVLLRGSVGGLRAYNTNDLWLLSLDRLAGVAAELVAEGNLRAIKIRPGRPTLTEDIKALKAVRDAIGSEIALMSDFNQGLALHEAIARCHGLDDQGLYWFEEPVGFDNHTQSAQLARDLQTPVQIGENIYGPRSFLAAMRAGAADPYMPDLMRIGGVTGWLRGRGHRRCRRASSVQPPRSRDLGTSPARQRVGRLARVARLGHPDHRRAVRGQGGSDHHPRPVRQRHRVGRGRGAQARIRRLTGCHGGGGIMDARYPAEAVSFGGLEGRVRTSDGVIDVPLSMPKELARPGRPGRTNPETLLALGYAVCLENVLLRVAREPRPRVAGSSATARVDIGPKANGGSAFR